MAGIVQVTSSLTNIYSEDILQSQQIRWRNLFKRFKIEYGHLPSFVSRSPGRVNIIGEHIDYSLYGVLPMAITADVLLAVSTSTLTNKNGCHQIRISNIQSEKFQPHLFEISNDTVVIDSTIHEWTNYFKAGLRGAIEILRKKHGSNFKPASMEIIVDGSIPVGSGLSSSAALVSASALAVMFANGEDSINKIAFAELVITSERAVGVNSGGMDQSASILSLRDSALYVSFVPELTTKAVKFPKSDPEFTFLIAQSFVQSNKHVTGPVCYNLRVVECSMAAAFLNSQLNKKDGKYITLPQDSSPLGISLRSFQQAYFSGSSLSFEDQLSELVNLTKRTLTEERGYTQEEIAKALDCSVSELKERFMSNFPVCAERFLLRQRAIHVFTEARRTIEFLSLIENQKSNLDTSNDFLTESFNQKLGDLMNASQDSCRDNYECSCPEINDLCEIARRAGSYGSRLTGAGWGGCTVHLVPNNKLQAVSTAWEDFYYRRRELTPEEKINAVITSKPGYGSAVFVLEESDLTWMNRDGE